GTWMKIYGVDFTSRPCRTKPITCLEASLEGNELKFVDLKSLPSFEAFEDVLRKPGQAARPLRRSITLPPALLPSGCPSVAGQVHLAFHRCLSRTYHSRFPQFRRPKSAPYNAPLRPYFPNIPAD